MVRPRPDHQQGVVDEFGEIDVARTGVTGAGEFEELVDRRLHALALTQGHGHVFHLVRPQARILPERLEKQLQRGQRIADLVGHARRQSPERRQLLGSRRGLQGLSQTVLRLSQFVFGGADSLLQPRVPVPKLVCHAAERRVEASDLVGSPQRGHVDRALKVALRQRFRREAQGPDRRSDAGSKPPREAHRADHRRGHGELDLPPNLGGGGERLVAVLLDHHEPGCSGHRARRSQHRNPPIVGVDRSRSPLAEKVRETLRLGDVLPKDPPRILVGKERPGTVHEIALSRLSKRHPQHVGDDRLRADRGADRPDRSFAFAANRLGDVEHGLVAGLVPSDRRNERPLHGLAVPRDVVGLPIRRARGVVDCAPLAIDHDETMVHAVLASNEVQVGGNPPRIQAPHHLRPGDHRQIGVPLGDPTAQQLGLVGRHVVQLVRHRLDDESFRRANREHAHHAQRDRRDQEKSRGNAESQAAGER